MEQVTKDQVLQIADENSLFADDIEKAIEFVEQLVQTQLDLLKAHRPQAFSTIDRLETTKREITNLYHEISETINS